ncbi:hypothetical protein BH11PSE8_BH11PSE8_01240 [soil metagenome]
MSVSKQEILSALAAIEQQSPAYFGDMPIADDDIRDIFASAMATLSASDGFDGALPVSKEVSLLATLTHTMLEVAYLRYRLQETNHAAVVDAGRLFGRLAPH